MYETDTFKNIPCWEFPGCALVRTLFPLRRPWVWSLAGEPRSHKIDVCGKMYVLEVYMTSEGKWLKSVLYLYHLTRAKIIFRYVLSQASYIPNSPIFLIITSLCFEYIHKFSLMIIWDFVSAFNIAFPELCVHWTEYIFWHISQESLIWKDIIRFRSQNLSISIWILMPCSFLATE